MSELQCVTRLKIHDGKLNEFKRLAAEMRGIGAHDNTECLVFERYRDSQALLDHHTHLEDTMAAMLQTCSGPGAICGAPSPELMERLKDALVQVYKPFQAN